MSYTNYNAQPFPFPLRYVNEVARYRHLCWNLVGSDLRSRFRRSQIGILWAVVQPLAFSLMIAVVYGTIFKQDSYWQFAVYVFSGMLVWEYFTSTAIGSLDALVNASGYLRQLRIPFLVFQMRGPLVSSVIFLFGFAGLVTLLLILGQAPPPGWHLLLIPMALVFAFLFVMPVGIILSILGAKFRDMRYITMIVLQAMFFVTPVMLTRDVLQNPKLEFLHYVNPAVPLISLFREPLLYGQLWDPRELLVLMVWTVALWAVAAIVSASFGRRIIFSL